MIGPWAIMATAAEADPGDRAGVASEFAEWLEAGGAGVALVTCHRAELYGVGPQPAVASPVQLLAGQEATAHLLRVACGLESVIVGEDEVLNQVREAMRRAAAARQVDRRLHRLFEMAIAAGRRARSGRTQSSGNLAQAAVMWLQGKVDVSGRMVVVGGAGHMGAVLAHSLAKAGANVVVCSRDEEKAARLARIYAGEGAGLWGGAELVGQAAAVAVALGGPWSELQTVSAASLPPIADISAPQAVPDNVRGRLNGNFLGIDDLYHQARPLPGAYIKDAKRVVALKSAEYAVWLDRAR